MVSLKDIAAHCGVSVATVSKALNGAQDISEETRERIRREADEMGYIVNAAARALKTNRSYNIGVLFLDNQSSGLAHEFFSNVLDSLRVEAERSGYDITFINESVSRRAGSYLLHCQQRGVDGVVIVAAEFQEPMIQELMSSSLPVVTVDHVFNNRIAVVSDNIQGMQALTEYVIGMGHRKLAFIHGEQTAVTENRLIGFHRACDAAGITVPEKWLLESPFHAPDRCYAVTTQLLSDGDKPDCIFFPDDFSCIGGMNAVRDAGFRIPEDISVVGYDGIRLSQVISPKLTTWAQNAWELGRKAAAGLVELIERPRTAILDRQIVYGRLLEGESVRRLS